MKFDARAGLLLSAIRDTRFLVGLVMTESVLARTCTQPEQNLADGVNEPPRKVFMVLEAFWVRGSTIIFLCIYV